MHVPLSLGVLFCAQGFTYNYDNPTSATLAEVNPTWHLSKFVGVDNGLGRIKRYQQQDPRTTFMSTFPVRRLSFLSFLSRRMWSLLAPSCVTFSRGTMVIGSALVDGQSPGGAERPSGHMSEGQD